MIEQYPDVRLRRMGNTNDVFIIPCISMDDPDVELLFYVAESLQKIAMQLMEYAKERI